MKAQMIKLGIPLMVVGLIAALGLGLTYTVTKKKIAQADRLTEAKACVAAMPGLKSASDLIEDRGLSMLARKKVDDVQKVLTCKLGYIMVIKTKGYGGPLVMAVGINKQGNVEGIAVVSNKETMGLGSKALLPGYLDRFKGKNKGDPLVVGKDVQAVTGATVTSKAVTRQVKEAIEAYDAIK